MRRRRPLLDGMGKRLAGGGMMRGSGSRSGAVGAAMGMRAVRQVDRLPGLAAISEWIGTP